MKYEIYMASGSMCAVEGSRRGVGQTGRVYNRNSEYLPCSKRMRIALAVEEEWVHDVRTGHL